MKFLLTQVIIIWIVLLLNKLEDWQPIINISEFNSTGIYAPLTTTGTLLVNNILVSCYANLEN